MQDISLIACGQVNHDKEADDPEPDRKGYRRDKYRAENGEDHLFADMKTVLFLVAFQPSVFLNEIDPGIVIQLDDAEFQQIDRDDRHKDAEPYCRTAQEQPGKIKSVYEG